MSEKKKNELNDEELNKTYGGNNAEEKLYSVFTELMYVYNENQYISPLQDYTNVPGDTMVETSYVNYLYTIGIGPTIKISELAELRTIKRFGKQG